MNFGGASVCDVAANSNFGGALCLRRHKGNANTSLVILFVIDANEFRDRSSPRERKEKDETRTCLTPISRHPQSDTPFVTTQKYVENSILITKTPY